MNYYFCLYEILYKCTILFYWSGGLTVLTLLCYCATVVNGFPWYLSTLIEVHCNTVTYSKKVNKLKTSTCAIHEKLSQQKHAFIVQVCFQHSFLHSSKSRLMPTCTLENNTKFWFSNSWKQHLNSGSLCVWYICFKIGMFDFKRIVAVYIFKHTPKILRCESTHKQR